MSDFHQHDAEREYRLHLNKEKEGDPALYRQYMDHLGALAKEGARLRGPGVLFVVDNGAEGFEGYVPAESADLQFGDAVSALCASYDPETQWVLVAITGGTVFPILMEL